MRLWRYERDHGVHDRHRQRRRERLRPWGLQHRHNHPHEHKLPIVCNADDILYYSIALFPADVGSPGAGPNRTSDAAPDARALARALEFPVAAPDQRPVEPP